MAERRFDTDTLLEQVLEGDSEAFRSFYERHRGRVYRFVVRLFGNGQDGQAAYLSVWARFAASRMKCKDSKALKLAFFKSLENPLLKTKQNDRAAAPLSVLPRELEEEGEWSVVLVQMIKNLPDDLRKRFLFRYEIGLSVNAISQIFGEQISGTHNLINDAELILKKGLSDAGCTRRVTLEALYRETRFIKPPASWDRDILQGYQEWIEKRVPKALLKEPVASRQSRLRIGVLMHRTLERFKPQSLSKNSQQPISSAS